MMGERRVMQEALFYGFSLERHVPDNHLKRTYRIAAVDAHMGKRRTFAIQAPIKTRPSNPASCSRR
jgi:hypothetical protein